MGLKITITATGIKETIAAIRKVRGGTTDYRPFFEEEVQPALRKEFRRAFTTRGFQRWEALAQATLIQKAKSGYPVRALVRTGRYRRATEKLEGMRVRRTVLEIRSPIPYARFQEFGTRNIPARPIFEEVAQRIEKQLPQLYRRYARRRLL